VKIANPLQMNDWEIKKFIRIVLAIQLALWGLIGLDAIGIQLPIARQLAGFIYLTVVPGIIILRILKLHRIGNIETILYAVGLSIATLMSTGVFMNAVYPSLGISRPILTMPLVITISVVILILCVLCYVRDKDFFDPSFINLKDVLSPPVLFLCLIPFFAVFGTYLVNLYHDNILLMLLIIILAIISLLVAFDKFIPMNLYPLAVFIIAISLLFHRSLISQYLIGDDIHTEYYFQSLVITNSFWDPTHPSSANAMLSITMLAPIYSLVSNMDTIWIFKIVYPIFFSLVPLTLFQVFRKQTNDKIAYLSCFFFMSMTAFYNDLLALARQEIAELFLVLWILAMVDKNMDKITRSFLFIIFGISLVVSHYGLSYIYMLCLITTWLILVLAENLETRKMMNNFRSKFSSKNKPAMNPNYLGIEDRTISYMFVLLLIVFALTWYMYVSSSITFNQIILIGNHMINSIFIDFLNPEAAQGLKLMIAQPAPGLLHEINRVINYLNQVFIVTGGIVLLLKHREMKFENNYAIFSILNIGICFAGVSLPLFASSLNMTRLYHITLIFLAPFYILGGVAVFHWLFRMVPAKLFRASTNPMELKLVVVLALIPFFLFGTGIIWEVSGDDSSSISLNSDSFLSKITYKQDMVAAEWLSEMDITAIVKNDDHACHILRHYGFFPNDQIVGFTPWNIEIDDDAFIFLTYGNIAKDEIWVFSRTESERIYYPVSLENTTFFQHNNRIYDSSSVIYAPI